MRSFLFTISGFLVVTGLLSCTGGTQPTLPPVAKPNGHIIGNGGDPSQTTFGQGRTQAIRVLQKLSVENSEVLIAKLGHGSAADLELLKKNANVLSENIRLSAHHWEKKLPPQCPESHCGCVFPDETRAVYFSYDACRESTTIRAAGSVILHEALHSVLKADEETARRVTTLAYEIWSLWGHPDSPHWVNVSLPESMKRQRMVHPILAGSDEMIVVTPWDVGFYHLGTGKWRIFPPKTSPLKVMNRDFDHWFLMRDSAHWVDNQMIVYASCYDQDNLAPGFRYSKSANEYYPLPKANALSSRLRPLQVKTDSGVFFWGGETCGDKDMQRKGKGDWLDNGAFFSVAGGWQKINPIGAPRMSPLMRGVWTGKEVIVWGGKIPGDGAAYDPKLNRWRNLNSQNKFIPQRAFAMVWTNEKILFYAEDKQGATYDPDRDIWERFNTPNGPELANADEWDKNDHLYIWNGSRLAHYQNSPYDDSPEGGLRYLNLPQKRWGNVFPSPYPDRHINRLYWAGAEYILSTEYFSARFDGAFHWALFYP